jgi:chemotaxis family two-component system response regulator Rcp1
MQLVLWRQTKSGKRTQADIRVLVVEDNPGDVRLTQEVFGDANKNVLLFVVNDGVEAMAFLRHEGAHIDAPRPDLILLDLNLTKMDGREVLALIKADKSLQTIPTVILTTSEAEADIVKGYQLAANCYLNKPQQLQAFEDLVKAINDFWLTRAQLPSGRRPYFVDDESSTEASQVRSGDVHPSLQK